MTYFCKINKKVDVIFSKSDFLTAVLKTRVFKKPRFWETYFFSLINTNVNKGVKKSFQNVFLRRVLFSGYK